MQAADSTVLTAMVREAKLFRGLRTWQGGLIIDSLEQLRSYVLWKDSMTTNLEEQGRKSNGT